MNDGKANSTPDIVKIIVNKNNNKTSCFITNIIRNKKTINLINKIKDKYLFQNKSGKEMIDLYYHITTDISP
ncbi:hypothetical protein HY745_08635 [Candidatus Desantisbacteria bacterium]|nr:hypothetical protein [Candidatus Desantisbacteria bacterium]